jgi:hypothetical protein
MVSKRKTPTKPKLTDAEQHKLFLDTAAKVEALDDRDAFEHAFDRIAKRVRPGEPDTNAPTRKSSSRDDP